MIISRGIYSKINDHEILLKF